MQENQLLLLRPARETINRIRQYKIVPVPSDNGVIPRCIGICDATGLRYLLRVSGGNCAQAYDCEEWFDKFTLSEFYSFIGNAKFCTIGQIKQASPDMRIAPSLFGDFPQFEGQNVITESYDSSVNIFANYVETVRLPEPKPAYSGLLKKSLEQLRSK